MRKPNLFSSYNRQKAGRPPGTPETADAVVKHPVMMGILEYNENEIIEKTVKHVEECFALRDTPNVSWINVTGIHAPELVKKLGDRFGLHPLVQEDILNINHRPKIEDNGEYIYIVLKMLQWDEKNQHMLTEQVSLIVGPRFVLSFQEQEGDVFGGIRDRLRLGQGRIRKMGADYLAYCLLDAIVDGYFIVLEHLGEKLENLEEETIGNPSNETRENLHRLRQQGLFLRKCVWPTRELVGTFERLESPLVDESTDPYLRDLYDHTVQVIDTTETFRELLSGMLDTYLSSISNRMNEVMKMLTIIATIFIPLTFIAGVYGMNFKHMPELDWCWTYPAVLVVMIAVAGVMLMYFRKKEWL